MVKWATPIAELFLPLFRTTFATVRCISIFQGIRSEDRTFAEGFAPTAEMFYGTRVEVRIPLAVAFWSMKRCFVLSAQ